MHPYAWRQRRLLVNWEVSAARRP
eukprot:symbB.v1.2.024918.t1/scaffold2392.1/size80309/1